MERGLYVLRYVSSDSVDVPTATVSPASGSERTVRIVDAPGASPSLLLNPGAALVIVSEGYATLEITVRAVDDQSIDAKLSLEPLCKSSVLSAPARPDRPIGPATDTKALAPAAAHSASSAADLDVLAHVARRGDVQVASGGWIAGPDSPAQIEGIRIQCRGAELAVSAQVLNSQKPGVWSPWWPAAEFVGTRQQASPLTGLRLRLVGRDAQRFEIDAEAVFLGKPVQRQAGSEVVLTTQGGLDPLVGLKLSLRPSTRQEGAATATSPRIRVFRSDKADLVNS